MRPLAVDLCCGLGGWTDGLLAENYDVIGFDIERHVYGEHRYPAQLVIQDIRTLTGHQFRGKVSLIVASPPCQKYSYMAMPWSKAKALRRWYLDPAHPERIVALNELFDACVRIGREAECPIVIENVRGANEWVGRSRWNFGSFHLWGDVPALMPMTFKGLKVAGFRFDGNGGSFQTAAVAETGVKAPGMNWSDQTRRGQDFTRIAGKHAAGIKSGGDWFNADQPSISRMTSSKSPARKAASAMIAKIPEPLSRHIARTYYP